MQNLFYSWRNCIDTILLPNHSIILLSKYFTTSVFPRPESTNTKPHHSSTKPFNYSSQQTFRNFDIPKAGIYKFGSTSLLLQTLRSLDSSNVPQTSLFAGPKSTNSKSLFQYISVVQQTLRSFHPSQPRYAENQNLQIRNRIAVPANPPLIIRSTRRFATSLLVRSISTKIQKPYRYPAETLQLLTLLAERFANLGTAKTRMYKSETIRPSVESRITRA